MASHSPASARDADAHSGSLIDAVALPHGGPLQGPRDPCPLREATGVTETHVEGNGRGDRVVDAPLQLHDAGRIERPQHNQEVAVAVAVTPGNRAVQPHRLGVEERDDFADEVRNPVGQQPAVPHGATALGSPRDAHEVARYRGRTASPCAPAAIRFLTCEADDAVPSLSGVDQRVDITRRA